MRICGIDPGLLGGVAFVDFAPNNTITSYSSAAMPRQSLRATMKAKVQNFIDVTMLHDMIRAQHPELIAIERQRGLPNQNSASTHTSGINYGLVLSLWLLGIPLRLVEPDQWKHRLMLSAKKPEAIDLCRDLFGPAAPKKDGPAEALLIAWYARLMKLE